MITAKEALNRTFGSINDRMPKINKQIEEASKNGLFSIAVEPLLSNVEIEVIKEKGYRVLKIGITRKGHEISWQFAK